MRYLLDEYKNEIEVHDIQIGEFTFNDNFHLSKKEAQIIYKTFDKYYLNKLTNTNLKSAKNNSTAKKKRKFKPKIN